MVSIQTNRLKFGKAATITANYAVGVNDLILPVNASGGSVTITLPPANSDAPISSRILIIKSIAAVGANSITITPNGSDTIDGAANLVINNSSPALLAVLLCSDGVSNWMNLLQTS
jgi:hypothetical protein